MNAVSLRPQALLSLAAALAAAAALAGGALGGAAARAVAVLAALGLAAAAVRERRCARSAPARAVAVRERHALAREAGVALVDAGGRRLLLGYGAAGVALLAELGSAPGPEAPP